MNVYNFHSSKHFLNSRYEYILQMSELMMSSPHNFPWLYFVHRNDKNPIFQLWETKTGLIATLNKCRIMFAPIYFDMGTCFYTILYTKYMENCEAMGSSIHSFVYSYQLFKKCFAENYENSYFISILFLIRFTSNFHCSILNILLFLLN